jgi:taurine dioxygenase
MNSPTCVPLLKPITGAIENPAMSAVSAVSDPAASPVTVRRIGANLGAEVNGVDLRQPVDAATFAAIDAALVEHEVLVFRDQPIDAEQQKAFGRLWGDLTVHPFAPADGDAPELIVFDNDEKNPPWGTDMWHSDETFRAEPPLGTMLRALIVPEIGGDTLYSSMSAAYEGLSDRIQQFLSGLEAVHDFKPFRQLFGDDAEARRKLHSYEDRYPPASHPIVREHPVSGRKVLFVNRQFTVAIKGMDENEGRSLLETLFHQVEIPEYQYRHRWQPDTLVFWDNRSVQHYAIHDYWPQRRKMERITIRGDRPFGAAPTADPGIVRSNKARPVYGDNVGHGGHAPQDD